MIKYQLNPDGTHAQKIVDNVKTGIWCCVIDHQEYLAWVAEGNLPIPAESTDDSSNHEPEPADGE